MMMKFNRYIAPKPGVGSIVANVRVAKDTGDRIDQVLYGGELRSDFLRAAIEKELIRRERDLEFSVGETSLRP